MIVTLVPYSWCFVCWVRQGCLALQALWRENTRRRKLRTFATFWIILDDNLLHLVTATVQHLTLSFCNTMTLSCKSEPYGAWRNLCRHCALPSHYLHPGWRCFQHSDYALIVLLIVEFSDRSGFLSKSELNLYQNHVHTSTKKVWIILLMTA